MSIVGLSDSFMMSLATSYDDYYGLFHTGYHQRLSTTEAAADDVNIKKRGQEVQTAKGRWPRTQTPRSQIG
jgi:hypothetical protein